MKVGDLVLVRHWINMGEKAIIVKEPDVWTHQSHNPEYGVRIIRTGNSMRLRQSNMEVISESR